jgi:hypothetical protein
MADTVTRQPVFVLGHARSGTTLVQRVLNSYEDVLVWGEHAGVLRDVAAAWHRAATSEQFFRDARPLAEVLRDSDPTASWQAWMTWVQPESWTTLVRSFVEGLFLPDGLPGKRVWGFKEVRYRGEPTDPTFALLRHLYPEALWVFVVRHPLEVMASQRRTPFGPRTLAELRENVAIWCARYDAYRALGEQPDVRAVWVRYDDLVGPCDDLQALVRELGRSLGPPQRRVLEAEGGRGSSFTHEDPSTPTGPTERWRILPRAWIGLIDARTRTLCDALGLDRRHVGALERLLGRLTGG